MQDQFGRYVEVEPETIDVKTNVTKHMIAYSYTGWWPDANNVGQGIAVVWRNDIKNMTQYQGEWGKIADFPDGGRDLTFAPAQDYKLVSLNYRERNTLFAY